MSIDSADIPTVTIIIGSVTRRKGGPSEEIHILLRAPDEDSAVRMALEALTAEGFAEAELDQIADLEGMPDEEPHACAWQDAVEGEIAIIKLGSK
jgi:hypothetical protein